MWVGGCASVFYTCVRTATDSMNFLLSDNDVLALHCSGTVLQPQSELQRKLAARQAKLVGDVRKTIRGVARKLGSSPSPSSSRPGTPKIKGAAAAANAANGNGRASPADSAAAAEGNGNGRVTPAAAAAGGAVDRVKELMNVLRSK